MCVLRLIFVTVQIMLPHTLLYHVHQHAGYTHGHRLMTFAYATDVLPIMQYYLEAHPVYPLYSDTCTGLVINLSCVKERPSQLYHHFHV